jgi:cyclomaltodextrinase
VASQAVNPDRPYDHLSGPEHDPRYDVRAPKADEWKRVRLAATFQFASLGVPLITYGTEVGMWGADDPDSRKPMLWADMRYEPEALLPNGQKRRSDPVRADEGLLALYQTLGRARTAQAALRRGGFELLLSDDERRIFAFARVLDAERVVCAFNGSERDATVDLALGSPSRDLLSGRRFKPKDGRASISLPALSAVLLAPERSED